VTTAVATPAHVQSPGTGQKIGKYQILNELGKGATSAVFLAHDPFANRKVAVKVVQREVLGD
jgi:serine/threonine protein kinase